MNYINTETLQYPVSEQDIKTALPLRSFAFPFSPPVEYLPVFPAPQPMYDPVLETVQEVAPVLTDKGHYEQTWSVVALYSKSTERTAAKAVHLAAQKLIKKEAVNAARKTAESAGLPYTFTDSAGTIQTADEDIRNVLAVTTTALVLNSQGIVDAVIPFRDLENVTHMLTPDEAITMGMAVQAFISTTYSDAWAKKAAIDAATTILQLNGVAV